MDSKRSFLTRLNWYLRVWGYFILNQVVPARRFKVHIPKHFSKYNILLHQKIKSKQPRSYLETNFTFMTWNVERCYQYSCLKKDLSTFFADINIMQEVPVYDYGENPAMSELLKYFVYSPLFFLKKKSRHYPFVHFGQLTASNYEPIDSNDITLPRVSVYSLYHNNRKFCKRTALYTKFRTKKGTLGVYNIHLENFSRPNGRKLQIEILFEKILENDDKYVVIAGDFNSVYGKFEKFNYILEENDFVRARVHESTCGIFYLDHIYHSKNMRMDARVLDLCSSDHKPIFADVILLD